MNMLKIRCSMLASLTLLLILPMALHAQTMSPKEVVALMMEAEKAADVEAQIALFAEDAVYMVLPASPDMPVPLVGKDAIRERRVAITSPDAISVAEIIGGEGDTVITTVRFSSDQFRSLGLEYIEGNEEYVVRDGKITNYTWTMTEASLTEMTAAMSPPAQ